MKIKDNKIFIYVILIVILLWTGSYFVFDSDVAKIWNENSTQISFDDISNKNENYLVDLMVRLTDNDVNLKLSIEQLDKKLDIIDNMYNEWLINASKNTYYSPLVWCSRTTNKCFSIRETYLFNFNF